MTVRSLAPKLFVSALQPVSGFWERSAAPTAPARRSAAVWNDRFPTDRASGPFVGFVAGSLVALLLWGACGWSAWALWWR